MRKLLLLNLAALCPSEVDEDMPNLQRMAGTGSLSPLREPLPALTCTSHATMVTGAEPAQHGIVANGWYERHHAKVFMWNRSAHQVEGETIWQALRTHKTDARCASLFWRFVADSDTDIHITERPVYWASGRKSFDFYSSPRSLHGRLVSQLGKFPFPQFWGPFAGMRSTRWILDATLKVMQEDDPELLLAYAPYLDYEGQRHGPSSPQAKAALRNIDIELGRVIEAAQTKERDIAIVSDYGFTDVTQPVMPNRILREAGYLNIEEAANGDQIEAGTSRAFAVCDNQAAHIYVANANDIDAVRQLLLDTPGVKEVLNEKAQREHGINHHRSGELLALADDNSWFAWPYWTDPQRAPDYEKCIAIFDKAGFDPCELFPPPGPFGKLHIAMRLAQKMSRLTVPFDVIDPNPDNPRGARKVLSSPQNGATLVTSWSRESDDPVPMQDLKNLLITRMIG
jgi:predicted AlkP superfamily pyrophosphatase or phosphodiesterase